VWLKLVGCAHQLEPHYLPLIFSGWGVATADQLARTGKPHPEKMHEPFGLRYDIMNTIHAYTNDQRILDRSHMAACGQL